jgi:hypothetical protein
VSTIPPCVGLHDLFDATDAWNHAKAAALCATCPLIDACAKRLAELQTAASVYGHPEGTWAGRLHLTPASGQARRLAAESRIERNARQEAAYTDADVRRAHTAYQRGDTSEWALIGHRIYGRRRLRARRAQEREAS